MDRIDQALELLYHETVGQKRLDGVTPKMFHSVRVADRMDNPEDKIVALLHDLVEDARYPVTVLDEIRHDFGDEIATDVAVLTRRETESYTDYIKRVRQYPRPRRIKVADLIDNIWDNETNHSLLKRYMRALSMLEPTGMAELLKVRDELAELLEDYSHLVQYQVPAGERIAT